MSYDNDYVLTAQNLHKFLGAGENRVHVLRGVNLELKPSQTYAIVGPSGCGKSTLLYLLGLLDLQDRGKIIIKNEIMSEASDHERTAARNRNIGFVFQFHFLLPEFTTLENIMLPMQKLGTLTREVIEERAFMLLSNVGLADKKDRKSNQLSGGEQQRVAVARALANNPAVLLADEPTGNLDVKNSQMVFDLLSSLSHDKGPAVLMVTHNEDMARKCDHVLRMEDGQFIDCKKSN